MSNTAFIRDITSLEELRVAIARFCEESENQLQTIDSKLQSRIGNLKSLESQFQRMIESAQEDLRFANQALSLCEANTYEDEDGNIEYSDCEYEQKEVIECRKRLELAEHNYNSFRREIRNLEIAIAEYQNPKVKYKAFIQFEKEAATSSLKQLINGAEDYVSVPSPLSNVLTNGLGLTEAVSKVDPPIILTPTVGVTEIIFMSVFSFIGLGGSLHNVSNKKKNGLITTSYLESGIEHTCSELKIEKKNSINYGKILSVNIPPSLQKERIGRYLVQNMEANCRANDCKEIYGWAHEANTSFYKGLGYETRNAVKESGGEIYKPLNSNFSSLQREAKSFFENTVVNKRKELGVIEVNPLNIVTPADFEDEVFWHQHMPEGRIRYMEQIDGYLKCKKLITDGKTIDDIKREDFNSAIAYESFIYKAGGDTIRLEKHGDFYRVNGGGRHRVTAAQLYYLQTGEIIPLTAHVEEIN